MAVLTSTTIRRIPDTLDKCPTIPRTWTALRRGWLPRLGQRPGRHSRCGGSVSNDRAAEDMVSQETHARLGDQERSSFTRRSSLPRQGNHHAAELCPTDEVADVLKTRSTMQVRVEDTRTPGRPNQQHAPVAGAGRFGQGLCRRPWRRASRLTSVGYGPDKPIETNKTRRT